MDHQELTLETWKVGCGHRVYQSSDSLSCFKRDPKVGDRKMCFHICYFNIMSLFSADDFVKKIMKINIELCNEKYIQGKNLKNKQQGLSWWSIGYDFPSQSKGMQI